MEKSALKQELTAVYNNRRLWNKRISIGGETYVYISARNEFRKEVQQPSGQILKAIGFMAFGDLKWIVW